MVLFGNVPLMRGDIVRKSKVARWTSLVRYGTFAMLQAAVAMAQTTVTDVNDQSALQEIVVTAQRREEGLDKVPISVAAFSQDTLDDLHIQSFADLATVAPGLVVTTAANGQQSNGDVAIRGIFSGGNAATTGIYIDETPIVVRQNLAIGFSESPQPDMFDLNRIEVLRGPQGTLFGSGAMGGAIRYITPQPNLDIASGYTKTEVSYPERGAPNYAVGVAYGAPIVHGESGFRLSGWFHSDGGFIDTEDPFTGQILKRNANSSYTYVLRPAITLAPTNGLTITPAAFIQYRHSNEPNDYSLTLLPNPEAGAPVSGFGWKTHQPATDKLDIFSLAVKYEGDAVALQSDSSYTYRNANVTDDWSNRLQGLLGIPPLAPSLSGYAPYDQDVASTNAWQQEFRLTSQDPTSRFTWVAGAYYRHDVERVAQYIGPDLTPLTELALGLTSVEAFGVPDFVLDGQSLGSYAWSSTVTDQIATFGEVSSALTSHLKLNLGVRVEHSVIKQQESFGGPLDGTTFSNNVFPDDKENPVTPRIGLTYQYTDQNMIYTTAAKGYRAGGSNSLLASATAECGSSLATLGLTSAPIKYNPDSLWSYEVGAKGSLLNRRVAYEASAFYIDWTGIQTSVGLPSCGQSFTTNRGKAVSQGFDFQIATVLMSGFKLGASVGYDKAYYPNAQYGTPSNGITPLIVGSGDRIAGVSPWSASINLEYSRDVGRVWEGARSYIRADWRWLDAFPKADPNVVGYDPSLLAAPYNAAYSLLNLRLGVIHGGLDLSAFVNNATRSSPLLGENHWFNDSLFTATAVRPLTVGVSTLYRY